MSLIWMCALHCEAKPVIDHYRLKKRPGRHGFDLYSNDDIHCVVSGVGAINMASACGWAAASCGDNHNTCWINLGIGGHRELEIGTAVLANRFDNHAEETGHHYSIYPVPLLRHSFQSYPSISLQQPSTDYHPLAVYDLEAYAYAQSCSRFAPLELCQSVKIISDNAITPPDRDKARISALVAAAMPEILDYASALQALTDDFANQSLDAPTRERFTALAHFTEAQRVQLDKLLLALRAADPTLNTVYDDVRKLDSSKQIIAQLRQRLHSACEAL